MSILIKGMKKPKSCDECPLADSYLACDAQSINCPIVEVPTPHGRLKDEDELIKSIHDDWDDVIVWDESGPTTADAFERLVYEQPTIIEAEKGEGK